MGCSRSADPTVAALVAICIVAAIVGPSLAPYDPIATLPRDRLQPPNIAHWLGTDAPGRDVLSRLLYRSRISMITGVIVGLVAVFTGVPIGVIAGYCGEPLDSPLMRLMDVLLALPGVLLAIGIIAAMGPGLQNVMIAVGIVAVASFARVARAATLQAKEMLFVDAARAIGGTIPWILSRHILPNVASPLIVLFTVRVATGILTGASLGFLGLGAQPPEPEWGAMLSDGRTYLRSAPHVTTMPGLAIMLVVLGFNLLGDGLRDALDPHQQELR